MEGKFKKEGRYSYFEVGEGTPIVVLHGLMGGLSNFNGVADYFSTKGYKIIMWDVLSADFDQSITSKKCLDNVLKNTTNGSIIVFHDSVKAFGNLKYVLPETLAYFSNKGYTFNTLPN